MMSSSSCKLLWARCKRSRAQAIAADMERQTSHWAGTRLLFGGSSVRIGLWNSHHGSSIVLGSDFIDAESEPNEEYLSKRLRLSVSAENVGQVRLEQNCPMKYRRVSIDHELTLVAVARGRRRSLQIPTHARDQSKRPLQAAINKTSSRAFANYSVTHPSTPVRRPSHLRPLVHPIKRSRSQHPSSPETSLAWNRYGPLCLACKTVSWIPW